MWQAFADMHFAAMNEEGYLKSTAKNFAAFTKGQNWDEEYKYDKTNDLNLALKKNEENLKKFETTEEYKKWTAGQDVRELLFQARMKRLCGHRYTGSLPHDSTQIKFKDRFLAEIKNTWEDAKRAYRDHDLSKYFENGNGFMSFYCPESVGKSFDYDIKK